MSEQALWKLNLILGAVEGKYTLKEVSGKLDLGARRIKQLKKAFREHGASAVLHGNSGRHPANYQTALDKGVAISFLPGFG